MTKYAKVGEKIRIINPVFVERVGYPKTMSDMGSDYSNDVYPLIKKLEDVINEYNGVVLDKFGLGSSVDTYVSNHLRKAVLTMFLKKNNFGGNERSIHTYDNPKERGKFAVVKERKMVKTGVRKEHSLGSVKTHYIYTIKFLDKDQWGGNGISKIEAINCERECD